MTISQPILNTGQVKQKAGSQDPVPGNESLSRNLAIQYMYAQLLQILNPEKRQILKVSEAEAERMRYERMSG